MTTTLHPAGRPFNITFDEDVVLDMLIALRVLRIVTDEKILDDTFAMYWNACGTLYAAST